MTAMNTRFSLLAAAALACLPLCATAAGDASTLTLAKSLLSQAQSGQFDRAEMTSTFSTQLTQDQASLMASKVNAFGKPLSFALQSKLTKGSYTKYTYRVTFAEAAVDEQVYLDRSGKVAGLWFTPAPVTPAAGDASALTLAKTLFRQAQAGRLDRTLLTGALSAQFDATAVKNMASQLGPLGTPASYSLQSRQTASDGSTYLYRVVFAHDAYLEELVLDKRGKVAGLWFKPTH
jgi:hypothetical protein